MWKLGIEDDQGNKTVVNLVRDEYSIGRSEENTVRLTERNISRHHALLKRNGSGWLIEDKQSYNGCFVNGVRVADMHRLDHGDLVQLGDYRLEVVDEAATAGLQTAAPPLPTYPESGAARSARPARVGGPSRSRISLTNRRIVIGRGEECDISSITPP
jgi:predicted component of type VI protein secretion system